MRRLNKRDAKLFTGIRTRDELLIRKAIETGGVSDAAIQLCMSQLISSGDIDIIKAILISPSMRGRLPATALPFAARLGKMDIVMLYMDVIRLDLGDFGNFGVSSLINHAISTACDGGHQDVVLFLTGCLEEYEA